MKAKSLKAKSLKTKSLKTKSLEIHFLHSQVQASQLAGRTAVPIDVLRANTTMTAALANGANSVRPAQTVEEVSKLKRELASGGEQNRILCGGERQGVKIDGFDLGNSPSEYTADRVRGHIILFTTTNGTKTIRTCRDAEQIVLGSFVNLSAVTDHLTTFEKVALVCAGTDGEMTSEDILFAGAVAERLCETHGYRYANTQSHLSLNIARTFWQTAKRQIERGNALAEILKMTRGGKNLVDLGLSEDLEFAAQIDKFECVPILTDAGIVLKPNVAESN